MYQFLMCYFLFFYEGHDAESKSKSQAKCWHNRPEFSHLLYICLDLMGCIAIVESSVMIIASLVPNFLLGLIIGAGYISVMMMMTVGYFHHIHDLPKVFWRYPISYINYGAWGLQVPFSKKLL
ncbi:hypothetical protein RIF29_26852 [Crotalaria pallida]|uniref:ABC-2 type transporter transmembrane domain-containing protein n=1 Tax=Crotalaria pallida TaxID=3830 RepID=A0AAN9HYB0_CROPI